MTDDFKSDYLPRLKNNPIYNTLIEKCESSNDSEVVSLIHESISYSTQRSKAIVRNMGEYTLHDADHLFNVLSIASKLLGNENISNLSIPELQLLILSIFFHDLGMAPDEKEVLAWRKIWDTQPDFINQKEINDAESFRHFWFSQQDVQLKYDQHLSAGNYSAVDSIKTYSIADYIRKTHADRIRKIIDIDWKDRIRFRDNDLTVELALLCYSHNEPSKTLLEFDKKLLCGNGIYVCLPLIGIILRLADILDFDGKRTPKVLFDYLFIKNPTSLIEWKKHRSVESWEINSDTISFSAKCSHPVIESSIHTFCNFINHELSSCNNMLQEINQFNLSNGRGLCIKIPYRVNRDRIITKKDTYGIPIYIYKNTKFELSKRQVIELLMGTKLYGDPGVALRELLQNSIDACLLRQAQEKKWGNLYEPTINIHLHSEEGNEILEVFDNGTGMDQYIVDNYYSKIGSSFYKSSDFYQIKSESNANFNPTSRFGIGILSCFMISDTITVETRRVIGSFNYADPLNINIEGEDSIFYITKSEKTEPGTNTKITIRNGQNPWINMDNQSFITYVKNLIPKPPFKVKISKNQVSETIDEHSFHNFDLTNLIKNNPSWGNVENVRILDFHFDEKGIKGKIKLAILEKNELPVNSIEIDQKEVSFQGISYPLKKTVRIDGTRLYQESTYISVDEQGNLVSSNSHSHPLPSNCKVSLHGIDVPHNLTTESWQRKPNLSYLCFPFQTVLVFDVSGNFDLDLNSARTEILKTENWNTVHRELSRIICKNIKSTVSTQYWNDLLKVYNLLGCDQIFLEGLNQNIE